MEKTKEILAALNLAKTRLEIILANCPEEIKGQVEMFHEETKKSCEYFESEMRNLLVDDIFGISPK